jgi:hypothetical protein
LSDTEEIDQPQPPSGERVATRALVLAAVCCRGMLELDADPGSEEFWRKVFAWWKDLPVDVRRECELEEFELLDAPFRSAPQQLVVNASWRAESLAVLAWALGRSSLPRHDEQVEPAQIARSVGFLEQHVDSQPPTLRLRPELEAYREVAFAVHWRLREFSLNPRELDFQAFARSAWFGPLSLEGVALVDGDLAISGDPIGRAPASAIRLVTSIARERHLAANWLVDATLPFSETDTST